LTERRTEKSNPYTFCLRRNYPREIPGKKGTTRAGRGGQGEKRERASWGGRKGGELTYNGAKIVRGKVKSA